MELCSVTISTKEAEEDGRTAATARAGADQSGRERVAGRVQQFGDGSPQSGRVHAEFYLYFPQRSAGQVAQEHDRQPGACQEDLARTRRKHRALRSAIRSDQGNARGRADAERRIYTVGKLPHRCTGYIEAY